MWTLRILVEAGITEKAKIAFNPLVSKSFFCRIGVHKWHKGFDWADPKRADVCIKCGELEWHEDRNGNKKLKYQIEQLGRQKNVC